MSEIEKAARQALEAWQVATYGHPSHHKATLMAMTALRAALEQPADEPFAWCIESIDSADWCFAKTKEGVESNAVFLDEDYGKTEPFPLYTRPQPATWVGLTDEEIHDIYDQVAKQEPYSGAVTRRNVARAIEAKLREKNGRQV